MSKPNITVYFLGASRAIRIPWLLEELDVPYDIVSSPRSKEGVGPPEFKEKIPAPLKKSPTIKDGDLVVQESGAIVQYACQCQVAVECNTHDRSRYLLDTYDKKHSLLPSEMAERCKAYEWLHAAEGSFMLHALAILYARWKIPDQSLLPEMEKNMSANVLNDMKWIEGALKEQKDKGNDYLVRKSLTVADIMMGFSIEFILTRKLGTGDHDGQWPETKAWLKRCMNRPAYKKAVERSGYTLESHGMFKT